MNEAKVSIGTPPKAQDVLAAELDVYQRELSRLLAEGEEGRWILVKGTDVSTWDTFNDAIQVGYNRFGEAPFLVQQVLPEQPVARQPWQRSSSSS